MRATTALLQHVLRLTLFTRANCSLCTDAKGVLSNLRDKRHFEYEEVDVMAAGQSKWKDMYEFDTPVVHIDSTGNRDQACETTAHARKLMHRFSVTEVITAMDEVEHK
ncbi:hypothetical protein LTR53_000181 [Teratosphaeriaceae sp. CCFEE 6253]|nr:hypothetical protein LTR53_000181 [Teratosphaeriaceae sp. CCFEE 6253]